MKVVPSPPVLLFTISVVDNFLSAVENVLLMASFPIVTVLSFCSTVTLPYGTAVSFSAAPATDVVEKTLVTTIAAASAALKNFFFIIFSPFPVKLLCFSQSASIL